MQQPLFLSPDTDGKQKKKQEVGATTNRPLGNPRLPYPLSYSSIQPYVPLFRYSVCLSQLTKMDGVEQSRTPTSARLFHIK